MDWYSISGIVVIIVMILLAIILWKVSKLIMFLVQIVLFAVLMFLAYKAFFTEEGVDKRKIQEYVDKASDSAEQFVQKVNEKTESIDKAAVEKVQENVVQAGKDALDSASKEISAKTAPERGAENQDQK